jgi:hypothetical protein
MTNSFTSLLARVFLTLLMFVGLVGSAQERMSDKNVEDMMKNLKEDAKKFRSNFDSAIGKSTIRKTDQEKQAKALVESFQKQTEGMLSHFHDKKEANAELAVVRSSADQIDKLLASTPLGTQVDSSWARVKSEIATISGAFGK